MKIDQSAEGVLKRFMIEHFDFKALLKEGFFTKEMRHDYKAQAAVVCDYFGYESVYQYGAKTMSGHITFEGDRPLHIDEKGSLQCEPFITVVPGHSD